MAPSRAKNAPILPSTDPLPTGLRVPSTDPQLLKILSTLSRPALLDLATEWCLPENRELCGPYINEDFEDVDEEYTAATSYDELIELYGAELAARKGSKRELIDRILEGDWRHGISLQQLAMADSRSLLDTSGSRRWGAYEIYNKSTSSGTKKTTASSPKRKLPKFNPTAFISSIHAQISAITKAHYHISHPTTHPLILIRISLIDTPYATPIFTPGLLGTSKTIFLAFPIGAPSFIYIMRPTSASSSRKDFDPESTTLLSFVLKSIGPALSRTGQRVDLRSTSLQARSLDALLSMRGAGRSNAAGGGWSIFADEQYGTHIASAIDVKSNTDKTSSADGIVNSRKRKKQEEQPEGDKENLSLLPERPQNPKRPFQHSAPTAHLPQSKRARLEREAAGRFGVSSLTNEENKTALPRFDVRIEDPFPEAAVLKGLQTRVTITNGDENDRELGGVRIGFAGKDVFAGIRQLTEMGVIDAKRVPAWMTGEGNVSLGAVKQGRLKAWDGL